MLESETGGGMDFVTKRLFPSYYLSLIGGNFLGTFP